MRKVPVIVWSLVFAAGAYALATFLLVIDELFTLAFYCRTGPDFWNPSTWCGYSFPVGPILYGYEPWKVSFVGILFSVGLIGLALFKLGELHADSKATK